MGDLSLEFTEAELELWKQVANFSLVSSLFLSIWPRPHHCETGRLKSMLEPLAQSLLVLSLERDTLGNHNVRLIRCKVVQ